MRVAIPTFGNEVSPRFCYAREVLIVEIEAGREVSRATVALGDASYPERLRVLEERGVSLLICGGFNRDHLPDAERAGVHVVWGVGGPVEQTLRSLLAGKRLPATGHGECWCRRGHRARS